MPPESSPCHRHLVTQLTPLIPPVPHKSQFYPTLRNNRIRGRMIVTKRKVIPVLVLVLSSLSILRLWKMALRTTSIPAALPPALLLGPSMSRFPSSASANPLTEKELHFLADLISRRAPCNLLVFGLDQQYVDLSVLNAGGTTVFLEDNPNKLSTIKVNSNHTRVHKVEYQTRASEAYKLLEHARTNPECSPHARALEPLSCKLALKDLPEEVYQIKWDILVVDGPNGDGPEAPGRMATIYTASVLVRIGNITDVVVHDVDRIVEKWFSWEFLCEENLVSSKGKFWNFRIAGQSNSTTFCST